MGPARTPHLPAVAGRRAVLLASLVVVLLASRSSGDAALAVHTLAQRPGMPTQSRSCMQRAQPGRARRVVYRTRCLVVTLSGVWQG